MSMTKSFSHIPSIDRKIEGIDRVRVELDHFRRQTERLDLMNKLHGRMAGVLDVSGMIESYSVWLMPQVEHELVGYKNQVRAKNIYSVQVMDQNAVPLLLLLKRFSIILTGKQKHM